MCVCACVLCVCECVCAYMYRGMNQWMPQMNISARIKKLRGKMEIEFCVSSTASSLMSRIYLLVSSGSCVFVSACVCNVEVNGKKPQMNISAPRNSGERWKLSGVFLQGHLFSCIVVHVFPLRMCKSIREGGEVVDKGLTCCN